MKKLKKDGLLECLSKDLIQKVTCNENDILELKAVQSQSYEHLDRTISSMLVLSEDEIESIAKYLSTVDNEHLDDCIPREFSRKSWTDNWEPQALRQGDRRTNSSAIIPLNKNAPVANEIAANEILYSDTIIIGGSNTKTIDMASLG